MLRLTFVVDGFNLYHSVKDLQNIADSDYRWLDVRSLCASFLSAFGRNAQVADIFYFSALAYHRERWRPGTVARHKSFLAALSSTGVTVELARFKPKRIDYRCENCGHRGILVRHEEKETDVAIATCIVGLAASPAVDGIVVMSGDTDLLPSLRMVKRISNKGVYLIFPFRRHSGALAGVATRTFTLAERHYAAHQFPDPVETAHGPIPRPAQWQ